MAARGGSLQCAPGHGPGELDNTLALCCTEHSTGNRRCAVPGLDLLLGAGPAGCQGTLPA